MKLRIKIVRKQSVKSKFISFFLFFFSKKTPENSKKNDQSDSDSTVSEDTSFSMEENIEIDYEEIDFTKIVTSKGKEIYIT